MAICVTVVIVAMILVILSRRFPVITLQYKDSKVELRRTDTVVAPPVSEVAGTVSPSEKAGPEKELADALASTDPETGERYGYYHLIKAVEKRDRVEIEKVFEEFKRNPPFERGFPYELEVWKNSELLQAGFSDARGELERIEKKTQEILMPLGLSLDITSGCALIIKPCSTSK